MLMSLDTTNIIAHNSVPLEKMIVITVDKVHLTQLKTTTNRVT